MTDTRSIQSPSRKEKIKRYVMAISALIIYLCALSCTAQLSQAYGLTKYWKFSFEIDRRYDVSLHMMTMAVPIIYALWVYMLIKVIPKYFGFGVRNITAIVSVASFSLILIMGILASFHLLEPLAQLFYYLMPSYHVFHS